MNKKPTPSIVRTLAKQYGSDVIWTGAVELPVEVIPTEFIGLNWALSRGGFPRSRISELFGPESNGKSTLAYHLIACVQKKKWSAAYIDTEHSMDALYMRRCGVDYEALIKAQPDYGEQALAMMEELVDANIDLVVLDSIAGMIPKAELEGDMTDIQVGLFARMMAKSMRRIETILKGSRTAIVATNQVRDKIGQASFGFGPSYDTPGGRAWKHNVSVKVSIRKAQPIKIGKLQVGFMSKLKVVKNKVGSPNREIELPVLYRKGFDPQLDLVNLAMASGAVRRRGGVYFFGKSEVGSKWREVYDRMEKRVKFKTLVMGKIEKHFAEMEKRIMEGEIS